MMKTFLEIKDAIILCGQIVSKDESLGKGKFGYTCKRFSDRNFKSINQELNEKIEDLRIDNCLTDPKTREILKDALGHYKFTVEGLKKLRQEHKDLLEEYNKKEIEIVPYILNPEDVPEFTYEEREILTGLIV